MKEKRQIVENWLPRYTGREIEDFSKYILLVNFNDYVRQFAKMNDVPLLGQDKTMLNARHEDITIINFGMGSPNAAIIMDLLTAINPNAVLFLGKCGCLKDKERVPLGSYILPLAAIRGEGTSDDYMPPKVPALPAFALQKAISTTIRDYNMDYWTGSVYTTNRRVWEHDENFKNNLIDYRAMAIDMETATVFSVGFHNYLQVGALLMVSDHPLKPDGVKTEESDKIVTSNYADVHLKIGIDSLKQLINNGKTIKHLKFED